ncbi:ORF6C domain-containing protein [Gracilibacillus sp. HCP3S3_G5_1]|uniref:ORF6C domain-containing protein n=1 Tax=unclassified Gracilibacillus TaxID=2625209 RepID=UPI003F8CEF48
MSDLNVFQNDLFKVSAKIENDQVMFDLEEVAKNLGFTTVAKSGNDTVRWSRVNKYLDKYVSQEVGKGDLIPEPLVYKLAFKASNELAEKFQDWLAIEVIPSIRKTGSYTAKTDKDPTELLLETSLEHHREIKTIKSDVKYLKGSMRIDSLQQQEIQQAAKYSVVQALGGSESIAYEELSKKVFSAFWREFKQHFGVPRYGDIPKIKFDEAIRFIELWRPSTSLQIEIDQSNSQMTMS